MKTLALTILILGLAVLALGVKVFFVKGGRFPSGHAHDIKALKRRRGKNDDTNDYKRI